MIPLEWKKIGEDKRPDVEAEGFSGARYVIRKAGNGRNASHMLRVNGQLIEHFMTNASARIRAQSMETRKQNEKDKPKDEPELLLDKVTRAARDLERNLIRDALRIYPLFTAEQRASIEGFWEVYGKDTAS